MIKNLFMLQALVDVLFGIPLIFATASLLSLCFRTAASLWSRRMLFLS